jgi:hypothetical protein
MHHRCNDAEYIIFLLRGEADLVHGFWHKLVILSVVQISVLYWALVEKLKLNSGEQFRTDRAIHYK